MELLSVRVRCECGSEHELSAREFSLGVDEVQEFYSGPSYVVELEFRCEALRERFARQGRLMSFHPDMY